jgi:hypothetical protein
MNIKTVFRAITLAATLSCPSLNNSPAIAGPPPPRRLNPGPNRPASAITICNNATGSGSVNFSVNGQNQALGEGNSWIYFSFHTVFRVDYSQNWVPSTYWVPAGAIAQFYYDSNGNLLLGW